LKVRGDEQSVTNSGKLFHNTSYWSIRWPRPKQLLYIGPGYYLDGWLSTDRAISVCNQPPGSTHRRGAFTCVGWRCDSIWQV